MLTLPVYTSVALAGVIKSWDDAPGRVHCSNCRNARVSGPADEPMVSCAAGVGRTLHLVELIRRGGHGFARAGKCPDFEMSAG